MSWTFNRRLALVAVVLGSAAVMAQTPPTIPPNPPSPPVIPAPLLNPLVGDYVVVSGEENGQPVPADRIKGSTVKIAADHILGTDRDKKQFFSCSYVVDFNTRPWVISMKSTTPEAADAKGLIQKEGNTVTIIYAVAGGAMPKEFKTGNNQHMFVLRNTNPVPAGQ